MKVLSDNDLRERLLQYSNQVGFDTQKETFREVISFLIDIDQNFLYTLLSPDEVRYITLHRDEENNLKKRLEKVVNSL